MIKGLFIRKPNKVFIEDAQDDNGVAEATDLDKPDKSNRKVAKYTDEVHIESRPMSTQKIGKVAPSNANYNNVKTTETEPVDF